MVSDGSWERIIGRLEAIETQLDRRAQKLSEIRTQQQSKGSTVFSEAPFKSLRDAVSKLLFRSVFSASLAPDVFVNSSVQRVPSSSTSVKHEIEPVFQSSDEGANPNSVNECKNDDTKREDINVEPATEIKQKDGKQEFEFDEKQDSMKILKKRFHRDLVPSLDLIEPSKRRRLGTLGELSLGLQQRMKGNIENIWKAVNMACNNRTIMEIEAETQQIEKAFHSTTTRTVSIFAALNPEAREVLQSSLHYLPQSSGPEINPPQQQLPSAHRFSTLFSNPLDERLTTSVYAPQQYFNAQHQQTRSNTESMFYPQRASTVPPMTQRRSGFVVAPSSSVRFQDQHLQSAQSKTSQIQQQALMLSQQSTQMSHIPSANPTASIHPPLTPQQSRPLVPPPEQRALQQQSIQVPSVQQPLQHQHPSQYYYLQQQQQPYRSPYSYQHP